jgi:hypothetical protein
MPEFKPPDCPAHSIVTILTILFWLQNLFKSISVLCLQLTKYIINKVNGIRITGTISHKYSYVSYLNFIVTRTQLFYLCTSHSYGISSTHLAMKGGCVASLYSSVAILVASPMLRQSISQKRADTVVVNVTQSFTNVRGVEPVTSSHWARVVPPEAITGVFWKLYHYNSQHSLQCLLVTIEQRPSSFIFSSSVLFYTNF